MRKVYIEAKVKLIVHVDGDDSDLFDALNEMDYSFQSTSDNMDIVDTEILDYEVTDSK